MEAKLAFYSKSTVTLYNICFLYSKYIKKEHQRALI